MTLRWLRSGASRDQRPWIMLLLLLVVVIVPTVCVVWFMLAAIDNERLAVRQRLIDAYRTQLVGVKTQLGAWLQQQAATLDGRAANDSCAAIFAEVVRAGEADSLICVDRLHGGGYPDPLRVPEVSPERLDKDKAGRASKWKDASRLERTGAFGDAALAFGRIAEKSTDDDLAAQALQARARCLSKAGLPDEAIQVLTEELASNRYRSAIDPQRRLIVPSAQLLALQLIDDHDDPTFQVVARSLRERLADYGEPVIPASQRRFLMRELLEALPDAPLFDTLAAEDLAVDYLESETMPPASSAINRSRPGGVWQLASPGGNVIALHTEARLRERLTAIISAAGLPAEIRAELLEPGDEPDPSSWFVSFAAEEPLPGWRLALVLDEQALVDEAAGRQITVHVWTGLLVIALIIVAAGLIAVLIRRQMRLTQLKNDLLATVSHELKTPLASMRLLVETLLDGRPHEAKRVREYLELISKENNRLSRLVDNFLSFSRMERNKQHFEREEIDPAGVVHAATSAMGERFAGEGCRLDVEIAPGLPLIDADSDALVTVILNLLDNAYKYSGADKQIGLRAYVDSGQVCFAVRDNGIGLSGRARNKIFERFYQADQSLSRGGSGCGLGLSIVRFIVGAHGGDVDVESQPGKGSVFTVKLPAVGAGHGAEVGAVRQEAADAP